MRSLLAFLTLFLLLPACTLFGDDPLRTRGIEPPEIDVADLAGCEEIEAAVTTELRYLQFCRVDADCGQPLPGTSCGCTRDLVARADADTARFYTLLDLVRENQCGPDFVSTCDCPPADGFVCVDQQCTWNYTGAH